MLIFIVTLMFCPLNFQCNSCIFSVIFIVIIKLALHCTKSLTESAPGFGVKEEELEPMVGSMCDLPA